MTTGDPGRGRGLAACLVILGLAALPAHQGLSQVPPRDQRVPRYDASAVVKLIVVRVVDESGRAVRGLRKEDFVLTDNDEAKTITEFECHSLAGPETAAAALPAEPAGPAPARAAGTNRKIFIFLDLQGNDDQGNANAKDAALNFVETQLRPDDEVGVLGFSPMRGFFTQVYLTSDRETICKAIKGAKELQPSGGEMVTIDFGNVRSRARAAAGEAQNTGGAAGEAQNAGGAAGGGGSFDDVSMTTFVPGTRAFAKEDFAERMADLAQALKYIPGNKSLVLFSGRTVGPAAALGKAFADAGTPVYAVNTKDWIIRGTLSPIKEHYIWKEHPLKDLSLASGGEYFADIKDVQAISQGVQELTGNYYVLGYYVKENWDGAYHRIKVGIRKPGLRVLAQDGYFDPKPYAEMSQFEKDLQTFDLLYSEKPAAAPGPELPMTVLDAFLPGGNERILLMEAAVDPKNGVRPAEVELFALVRDQALTPFISSKWRVNLARDNGKSVIFCMRAPEQAGAYDSRVAIRDPATGWAAVGNIRFAAGAPAEGGIILSTPLLLVPGAEPRVVRLPSPAAKKGAVRERPFLEIYPFIPRGHGFVVGGLVSGTSEILAVVPVSVRATKSEGPFPRIEINGRLLPRSGGEEIPLDLRIIEVKAGTDGRQFLIIKTSLAEVPPGDYDLEIEAAGEKSGARDSVRTALVLK